MGERISVAAWIRARSLLGMRRSSHFADDLVDGRQLYDAKNAVNRVAGLTAFPEQHAVSAR